MTNPRYPAELVQHWTLRDGTRVVIRPIRPQDRQVEKDFVHNLSAESRYFRFLNSIQDLSEPMLTRFTEIDYDAEMALIAVITENGREVQIAVARYVINPGKKNCEFAIVVADSWQNKGIGARLMKSLMDAARSRGLETMEGFVLATNHKMLELMDSLGFSIYPTVGDPTLRRVTKTLGPQTQSPPLAVQSQ